MIQTRSGRRTLGYITASQGVLGKAPFFETHLTHEQASALLGLLAKADVERRCTVTITTSYQQPNRLRVTEVDPPGYEALAAENYIRGDAIRVQGREAKSCGLDLSARWGVPMLAQEFRAAMARAKAFVALRVPSRSRDLVEVRADVDLEPALGEDAALGLASAAAAALSLAPEDFSDWEDS